MKEISSFENQFMSGAGAVELDTNFEPFFSCLRKAGRFKRVAWVHIVGGDDVLSGKVRHVVETNVVADESDA